MNLQRTLDHIGTEREGLSHSRLYMLSGLSRDEMELFSECWLPLSTSRRRAVLAALVEIAEANVTVDFNSVFRIGLEDEDAEVRAYAIDGLWEDRDPGLMDVLLDMLSLDPSIMVRAAAATGLGRFVLMAELDELEEELGTQVVQALWKVVDDAEEALETRRRAVEAISYSSDEGVRKLIEAAYLHPDDKMRVSAVFSMGRSADSIWGRSVITELGSSSPEMRFEAARACGELELKEAVPALMRLIADPDREVQQASIYALGKIGGREARRTLQLCCESEDEVIATAGEEALSELELTAGTFDSLLDMEAE
jgi:HEAT repeat protein